tara:strand:- start:455 stop:667 length:213 start_codon:yes stop_codon:yes gene_type:complete
VSPSDISQQYSNIVFQTLAILLSESSLATAEYFGFLDVKRDFNLSTAAYTLSIIKSPCPTALNASDSSLV